MTTDGVRLGDLLTGAGLLQPSDLREAMMISKQQGLPVGRVLIMSGYLTEQNLQAAVQAQSLLKDGLIEFPLVIKALTMVGADDITLEEAFKRLKWNHQPDAVTNKLGELLLAAEIVPMDALNAALLQCQSIGLPLGRVLIANGVLTEQMLAATLNAQVFIRDKKLTREQAIQGLKSAKERQIPIEQYLAESGAMQLPTAETVRLGELFVLSGIIDEPNLMGAVEVGLLNEQPIGQVLLNSSMISQEILDAALDLQGMVGAGAIKKDEAGKFLGIVKNKKVTVGEAIALGQKKPASKKQAVAPVDEPNIAIEPLPLYQFLQLSGIITFKQIEEAIRIGSKDSQIMAKMLSLSGLMEQPLIDAAQKTNELIISGVLNHEQGMIVLKSCERNQFSLEQAFTELGWNTAPLRANPDVPEALLDLPTAAPKHEPVTETTKPLPAAQANESAEISAATAAALADSTAVTLSHPVSDLRPEAIGVETSDTLTPVQPGELTPGAGSLSASATKAWGTPEPHGFQPGSGDSGVQNPFGPTPAAISPQAAWSTPDTAAPAAAAAPTTPETPSLFGATNNPFDTGATEPASAADADPLAAFGAALSAVADAEPANLQQQAEQAAATAAAAPAPAAEASEPFKNSTDGWQPASTDEWMPTASTSPPEAASAPATDTWSGQGQGQQPGQQPDSWAAGQAQQQLGSPTTQSGSNWPPAQAAAPATSPDWAASSSSSQPAAAANTAAPAPQTDWATTSGASIPIQDHPASQADWAAAGPVPAPGQTDWAAPAAPGAEWANSQSTADGSPPQWATGAPAAAQPATQSDWAATPAAASQPSQPPAQPDWAATPAAPQPAAPQPAAPQPAAPQPAAPQPAAPQPAAPQPTAPQPAAPQPAAQPAAQADWAAAPAANPPQTAAPPANWAAPAPSAPASNAPTWAASPEAPQAAQPAASADWAVPSTSNPPSGWTPPPLPGAPAPANPDWAQSSGADWSAGGPAAEPAQAPAQPDWSSQPAAASAPAPTEWQPPTSAAPQEPAWQGPADAANPANVDAQPAQSAAPAPAAGAWQAAAPSPLPGWQSSASSSATNLQPPNPSPSAAQMFQEAAQSLAGTDGPQPQPAPTPAGDHQSPQIDLFSGDEEDHSDQSDKPKKRLSDLMPKFGQKS